MPISILRADLFLKDIEARMPFRYGIVTMTQMPHLLLKMEFDIDGERAAGWAAENLAPKWFTKNPATSLENDTTDMVKVVEGACQRALEIGSDATFFRLWRNLYTSHLRWCGEQGYPPLLAGLGSSLVERAAMDAFCRAKRKPLSRVLRENDLGLELGEIHPSLMNHTAASLLPAQPLRSLVVRHTVGLTDPIFDEDILPADKLNDGLPQSLQQCITGYGLTHFKIKLSGKIDDDLSRLEKIDEVWKATGSREVRFTLDGNENYRKPEDFSEFWHQLESDRSFDKLASRLLFVEQPLHRDVALGHEVQRAFQNWKQRPPIIIDESDATLSSLPTALEIGYAGTSHKNCKGIIKGIANACLIRQLQKEHPDRCFALSGEDLTIIPPIALLEDLAMMANLGIEHVERNGHHYFKGSSMWPDPIQQELLDHHGDLFHRHPGGFSAMKIEQGKIQIGSLVDHGAGYNFDFDPLRAGLKVYRSF